MTRFDLKLSIFCFIFVGFSSFQLTKAATTQLQFYSEYLSIQYNPAIIINSNPSCNEKSIMEYNTSLKNTAYQELLTDLQSKKRTLALNDWLYYELLRNTVNKLYKDKSSLQKTLTCWFLLSKSGYDTRLTYLRNQAFLYVYTKDNLFEVPMIEERGRTYINLTNLDTGKNNYAPEVYMIDHIPNPNGQSFSFYLNNLPRLKIQKKEKSFQFRCHDKEYYINSTFDMTMIHLMENYPIIDEIEYLKIPLSPTIAKSILPQLKRIIANKTNKEALEILVSFTRSAFKYKEDHDHFGKSKPMIADEVFHYAYSDCEDRSALFYNLVKELLDLPMIMIAYPDHLTIGVAISQQIGNPINYKGRKYYICDPTGPSNSTKIGSVPRNYERKSFEILGDYK